MDRVKIYIDSSNLYLGARKACGCGKVEIGRFCRHLAAGRPLVGVKYFCVDPPEPSRSRSNTNTKEGRKQFGAATDAYLKQIGFLEQLNQWKKIELIKGRLQRTKTGELKEKGVDVLMAIHIVTDAIAPNFETSIVVTGDADLVVAINIAKNFDKRVEGAAFQPCYHVAQACNKFFELNEETIAPFIRKPRMKS